MAKIKIGDNRIIELLNEKQNLLSKHIKIGNFYGELTQKIEFTKGKPLLKFSKDNQTYYIKEIFDNNFEIKFIDENTKELIMSTKVSPGTRYKLSIWDTSFERNDYLPIKNNKAVIGFIINDGISSPIGDEIWEFDRIINENTIIECKTITFDYYFESILEWQYSVDDILSKHNNDLSSLKIGFGDYIDKLFYYFYPNDGIFQNKNIIKTPSIIYGRKINSIKNLFKDCIYIENVSSSLFKYCINIENFSYSFQNNNSLKIISNNIFDNCINATTFDSTFENCTSTYKVSENLFKNNNKIINLNKTFKNCSSITSNIPNVWNTHSNIIEHSEYALGCIKSLNYKDIPEDYGGPKLCNIKFDVGDLANPINDIKIVTGNKINPPNIEVKDKYVLENWYTEKEFINKFDFNTIITSDIVLYAKIIEEIKDPKHCDYYFDSISDFNNRINSILKENNNNLINKTFGFNDNITDLGGLFYMKNLIKTPKYIIANNANNFTGIFSYNNTLNEISSILFKYCKNAINFNKVFSNCSSLISVPDSLFHYCNLSENFNFAFSDCTNLNYIGNKIFYKCENIKYFNSLFKNCKNIKNIPFDLFEYSINATDFNSCFYLCSSLTNIPTGLFNNCYNATDFGLSFARTYISSIPEKLFDNCKKINNLNSCFDYCEKLIYIPENLFYNSKNTIKYVECTFRNCINITYKIPELWNKNIYTNITNYYKYAYECKKASNYSSIPYNWK